MGMRIGMDRRRLPQLALLVAALVGWWIGDHAITPWIQRVAGYDRIQDRELSVLLGHWVFGQLPRVLVCVAVWLVGTRLGLMPSLRQSLTSGGSWRRVVVTGLVATAVLLVVTVGVENEVRAAEVLEGFGSRRAAKTGSVAIGIAGGPASLGGALRALEEAGIAVEHVELDAPSLDDVFADATGRRLEGAAAADDGPPEAVA